MDTYRKSQIPQSISQLSSQQHSSQNICFFCQPYSDFDMKNNPLILLIDRHGISMVNITNNRVYQLQVFEDQILHQDGNHGTNNPLSKLSSQIQDLQKIQSATTGDKNKDPISSQSQSVSSKLVIKPSKSRSMNIDMWQRYNDCIFCDSKSIPNTQGVLLSYKHRNMIIGFNKTLQFWKYEKSVEQLDKKTRYKKSDEVQGIFQGYKGQDKLPNYLRKPQQQQQEEVKEVQGKANKKSFSKIENGEMKVSYHNGVKNYQWLNDSKLDKNVQKYLTIDNPSPFVSFLSQPKLQLNPANQLRQINGKFFQAAAGKDAANQPSLAHMSELGTFYSSDYKQERYDELSKYFKR